MSTIKVDTIQNASGVEKYTSGAWVNMQGQGTISIYQSGNVSSLTDVGVGHYDVNFSNALSHNRYAAAGSHIMDINVNEDRMGCSVGETNTTYVKIGGGHNHDLGAFEDGNYSAMFTL